MQSRRDQLQAYRFMVRRAVGAVVTGDPDIAESPMRRLSITTISGIMVAILVAAGFGLYGLIRPGPSDDWKHDGAIVVDPNGSRYLYTGGELRPTTNYVSAVLAALPATGTVERVSATSLQNVPRGRLIGIDDLPDSLPSDSDGLTTNPWSVCSTETQNARGGNDVAGSLIAGRPTGTADLRSGTGVLAQLPGGAQYLLFDGRSYPVTDQGRSAVAGLSVVPVSRAFLRGIQAAGSQIGAVTIPGAGATASGVTTSEGKAVRVGDLISVSGGQNYVVTQAGFSVVSDFRFALLRIGRAPLVSTGPPQGRSAPPLETDLPTDEPKDAAAGSTVDRVCDTYRAGKGASGSWTLSLRTTTASVSQDTPTDTDADGRVGSVSLKGDDGAALIASTQSSSGASGDGYKPSVSLLAQTGLRYPIATDDQEDVLKALHFDGANPVLLPAGVLGVIPAGNALDPDAAREEHTG